MAFMFELEREDGTPADPPSFRTAAPTWRPGDTIPLGRKTLRVVAIRDDDADEAPVLVVEDSPERPLARDAPKLRSRAVPKPETLADELTCTECGRRPLPGERWSLRFGPSHRHCVSTL